MLKCNKKILKRLKQKKKGFTLLEIVVALAVIGIMMIPLGGALLTSVKANKMGEIKQEAKLISQEIIEKLRSKGNIISEELQIGESLADKITIQDTGSGSFNVSGFINGIEIKTGSTIEKVQSINESYGSDTYKNINFDMFFYIDNNQIKYRINDGENVDWFINTLKIKDEPSDNIRLFDISLGNEINVVWKDGNKVSVNGREHDITSNTYNIGVYVRERRIGLPNRINLHLENKVATEQLKYYFYGNKFIDGFCNCNKTDCDCEVCKNPSNHRCLVNDCKCEECSKQFRDSFKTKDKDGHEIEGRYLDGKIAVIDNIIHYEESRNKGLYTINLKLEKQVPNGATVKEETRTEFMVEDYKRLN